MNRLMTMTAALLLTLSLMACGQEPLPEVTFHTDRGPTGAVVVSERVTMRFSGFEPGARVTVRARMADGASSFAVFQADEAGSFDTARLPLWGSYSGADADGLFWSMAGRLPELITSGALEVVVSAELDGNEVLRARLERYATPELLPVETRDLCGGLPCPQPEPLIDLPQDPVPLAPGAQAAAMNDVPEDPCGVGPRPVGPQALPELEATAQQEEVIAQ